jgi:hypothetical protein
MLATLPAGELVDTLMGERDLPPTECLQALANRFLVDPAHSRARVVHRDETLIERHQLGRDNAALAEQERQRHLERAADTGSRAPHQVLLAAALATEAGADSGTVDTDRGALSVAPDE